MKVFVFLFLFITTVSPITITTPDVYECSDAYVEIFDGRSLTMRKVGLSPFNITIDDGADRFVNNVICSDQKIILYGYGRMIDGETYYDGFISIFDLEGNLVHEVFIDYEMLEEVKGLYEMNGMYVAYTRQRVFNETMDFNRDMFVVYDQNLNFIKDVSIDEEVIRVDQERDLLLIGLDYDEVYEYGINRFIELIDENHIFDLEQTYSGEVALEFINEGIVNGDSYINGVLIDYPGNYEFVYQNQVYEFSIEPIITGVNNGNFYYDDVSVSYSGGNATLNGDAYASEEIITKPGNYVLHITGVNEYQFELQFVIVPEVSGVIDGQMYSDGVTIQFEGDGFLNNNIVTSPLVVDQEGDYILQVKGVNGYQDVYSFSVYHVDEGITLEDVVKNVDIFVLVIVVVVGVVILKKK